MLYDPVVRYPHMHPEEPGRELACARDIATCCGSGWSADSDMPHELGSMRRDEEYEVRSFMRRVVYLDSKAVVGKREDLRG